MNDQLLNHVRSSRAAGLTLQEIADGLNAAGLTTRKGKSYGHKAISRMLEETRNDCGGSK